MQLQKTLNWITSLHQRNDEVDMNNFSADDLLLFSHVMEAGSFSKAALRVGLPKSTVSRRIAALEKRLGERLLQRTTRQLAITEFGQGVLEHARAMAAELDGALSLALHRQVLPSGRLRVSMPGDFANVALGAMLSAFVQRHPAIALEIDLSPRRVDLIGESFDLALRMGAVSDDAQLHVRSVATFTMGLYAARSYLATHGEPRLPEALTSLHGLMILSRTGEALPWELTRGSGADQQRWKGVPEQRTLANAPDLLLRLARGGAGITAVGDLFAAPHVDSGELVRVLPDWCLVPTTAWAVFPGRRLMPTKTRAFIDALVQALQPCSHSLHIGGPGG
jgi:DNA-binding transcriptional LysR family regulator